MRIAIAQIDSTIADFSGNLNKIRHFTEQALSQADIVFFPELSLCGYPPLALLEQSAFQEANLQSLQELQSSLPKTIVVGIGFIAKSQPPAAKPLANSYGLFQNGQLIFRQDKHLLPESDYFNEARYFAAASQTRLFDFKGQRLGIVIGEDLWKETSQPTLYHQDPIYQLLELGADLIVVPSASAYSANKQSQRLGLAENLVARSRRSLVYINTAGANDSLVFDGRSFIIKPGLNQTDPAVTAVQAAAFTEDLVFWETDQSLSEVANTVPTRRPDWQALSLNDCFSPASDQILTNNQFLVKPLDDSELDCLEEAIVSGISGYMKKSGFQQVHLGLSGGLDSALVGYLAVRAAGAENVVGFGLPSRYSPASSLDDARALAIRLGIRFIILAIEPIYSSYLHCLEAVFEGRPFDVSEENLQARIRGQLLMAYANKFSSMLLTTGNKSELAMGYCTLYGDMCGTLAPIADLFKTELYALGRRINQRSSAAGGIIPESTLTKPPSAELRPNQSDQDSLPPYDQLDDILRLFWLAGLSAEEIIALGRDPTVTKTVIKTLMRSEFKRRQAAPLIKLSTKPFGLGQWLPMAKA